MEGVVIRADRYLFEVNKGLEKRVNEKTQEIKKKNQQLETVNIKDPQTPGTL